MPRGRLPAALALILLPALCLLACVPPPNGSRPQGRIVFQTDRDGNWELYVMNADGSGQQRLTDDPAEDWLPRRLPAPAGEGGSYVVFVSDREEGWHLYLLDVDAALRRLATSVSALAGSQSGAFRRAADCDPRGASGVAEAASAGGGRLAKILEKAQSGEPMRLTYETENNWDPAPSPDGRYLAYSALSGSQRDVFLLDLETGETANLTRHPAEDWLPAWVPGDEGRAGRLAFVSDRDGNMEIYLLDLASGQATNLTQHPANDWVPVWAPGAGGTLPGRLAFQSDRDGNWEIYLLDLASGAQTNVTRHSADDWDPAWAPDADAGGGWLAFMSWRDGNREVYAVNVDGKGAALRLTDNPAADKNPAWLP